MAEQEQEQEQPQQQQSSSSTSIETSTFTGGMSKDTTASFAKKGTYSHARNATNNNHDGEQGTIGNEAANKLVATVPYTIIEIAYIVDNRWVIFSTDETNCEIGIFEESTETYTKVVNQSNLGFSQKNLIVAQVKRNFDCTYSVYWTDTGNSDRMMNLDNPPYIEIFTDKSSNQCTSTFSTLVDLNKLQMARAVVTPSMTLNRAKSSGNLLNGTYQCVMAYAVNSIKVTDYFLPSNAQSLFTHQNSSGALELTISTIDTSYDEFELVLISNINLQATAKRIGIYSTRQKMVMIDYLDATLPTIPLENIVARSVIYDKSDSMSNVNNYLLRVGVTTKPDFNYQPQANLIGINWVAVELPADYYYKGGNLTSYMRDDQQPFFIRWIYDSAQVSADYPLAGRAPESDDLDNVTGTDVYELGAEEPIAKQKWQVQNTASITSLTQYDLTVGRVIAEGKMGYWESTETYPQIPAVWDKLCGKKIRHSKFPDSTLVPHMTESGTKIVLMAAKFTGVTHPLDMAGNPIADIVGYEFLKASREGHKTIIAKGLINNAGEYTVPDGITTKKGLYTNYPFNDLRTDPFLSAGIVKGGCNATGYATMGTFRKDVFSFHSPDTQFRNPYLSTSELKVYGEMTGTVTGGFQKVFKHPRHKLIRDFALIVSGLVGVGEGLLAVNGKTTTSYEGARAANIGGGLAPVPSGTATAAQVTDSLVDTLVSDLANLDITGISNKLKLEAQLIKNSVAGLAPGTFGGVKTTTTESTSNSQLPMVLRVVNSVILFSYYFAQGTEQTLRIIRALSPFQQYALQYTSHGFYDTMLPSVEGNSRREVTESSYVEPHLQEFASKYRVNNLFRSRQVLLQLGTNLANPTTTDTTRQTVGSSNSWTNPLKQFNTVTSAYYAALKVPMEAQFGQIDSMHLLPASTVIEPTVLSKTIKMTSSIIFGGDTYINRYTEKNTFFYFNDWMHDLIDGTEWNYNNHYNIPNPRYWINTNEYDVSQLTSAITSFNFSEDALPNDLAQLDRDPGQCSSKVSFIIKDAFFYLFNSGVRDFFCESEVNLALRDYDIPDAQRHYDYRSYTDLTTIFNSPIIKAGNHFKYDYSLSVSKLLLNNGSWGATLLRDYNPYNQKCYTYYPNRIVYSLQQQDELKKDNWLVYLANNYKDFGTKVTTVRSVNKTGAIILFENASPILFQGIDQIQTEGGIKFSIGDGGLFEQHPQSMSNADRAFEHGSCQNIRSVTNIPYSTFWASPSSGKIFDYGQISAYASGIKDIGTGMKWWFARYLPFALLKDFPAFALADNSVAGIGLQSVYDNTNEVVYFCKKDYELKPIYKGLVTYTGTNTFQMGGISFQLADPNYFNNASWTISYDTKQKVWISYHDWFPDFLIPSKNHFLSVKGNTIWKHNERCDLYCNYYGIDYPFEVEYSQSTGQEITTLRSLEYQLECFKYFNDCRDAHNIQYENFDRLIVHNIEQISGVIKLQMRPKNSPLSAIQSTQNEAEAVSMFCSKVENKYRVDGINDLTRDRGEVSGLERQIWITEPNGYVRNINSANINYSKSILQRKKMRHYSNKIFLRKNISGSSKFLLKIVNTKLLKSTR